MSIDNTRKGDMVGTFSVTMAIESGNVLLNPKDIIECYFIEDIYKFSITGKLVFNDMYGFLEDGPFTGNERIIITYGEVEDRTLVFDIWKMAKIQQLGVTDPTAESMVEIFFVDSMFELYTLKKYSKSWAADTITTDIMSHIINYMCVRKDTNVNIEASNSTVTGFAMPYWTPIQSLQWLMRRSKSATMRTSGYLCYNNTEKIFSTNIRTLNWLCSTRNYIELEKYEFESDDIMERNKILEWSITGIDNTSTKVLRGGHWKGYDYSKKELLDVAYKYSDGIKSSMLLGKKSLFTDISDTNTAHEVMSVDSEEIIENIAYNKWIKRYSLQQSLAIVVRGFEDRYAGQQIEIKWPSAERIRRYNQQLKGKYLVKSITNYFTGGSAIPWRQKMVCLKNAYGDSQHRYLHKADQFNI